MPNFSAEYRALREAMRLSENKSDITYTYFSDTRLVRLQKDAKTRFIFGYCFDINREAAAELANDKAAVYEVMVGSGIAAVPHYLLSNVLKPAVSLSDLVNLFEKHKSLVIKPNGGNKGDFIAKFDHPEQALEYIGANPKVSWSASQYIDIAREIRIVVLNGTARLACEKVKPKVINGLKMYNLTLGATAKSLKLPDIDSSIIELAIQSAKAIGLNMGAVDVVFDHDGNPYVLEINDGFSLERFASSSNEAYTEVVSFYEQAIVELFKN
jgi:glutathione synthase/RimK-type ligase-like ATP-grasp enzyme